MDRWIRGEGGRAGSDPKTFQGVIARKCIGGDECFVLVCKSIFILLCVSFFFFF